MQELCTIFESLFREVPHYITIDKALNRIKEGASKDKVNAVRNAPNKAEASELKKKLPAVCFSGTFEKRKDGSLLQHSGFLVLDFDDVADIDVKVAELQNKDFIYALWVSPSGNGLKALIRIADGKKHRLHFAALKEVLPEIDDSGVNESRVCFESYDPHIYINENAKVFSRILTFEKIEARNVVNDDRDIFNRLIKWLTNKNAAFASGSRNNYIFRLASSCCRFGISETSAESLILSEYQTDNEFTSREATNTIKSAYRSNSSTFGTAQFENNILVDKLSRKEIEVAKVIDLNEPVKDLIYGKDVKDKAVSIYSNGYEKVSGINVPEIDALFKMKAGEVTLLSGIGNYGKSTFYKWYITMRIIIYGEKFAAFAPEDNPAEEYYHDFVEILLGMDCTPSNPHRPSINEYQNAYDFVSRHIFILYPATETPTPDYILERFLEVIIKHKVSGVCIDPHNQLAHDYGASGRTDQYLEQVFLKYSRFAQINSTYFVIVGHPRQMAKGSDGNYSCPDVFDMAGGAMWNNKMDNVLIYHKPFAQTAPDDPTCEIHSKKIKRQKTVGKRGFLVMRYTYRARRFIVNDIDPLQELKNTNKIDFNLPIPEGFKAIVAPENPKYDSPSAGIKPNVAQHYQEKSEFNTWTD